MPVIGTHRHSHRMRRVFQYSFEVKPSRQLGLNLAVTHGEVRAALVSALPSYSSGPIYHLDQGFSREHIAWALTLLAEWAITENIEPARLTVLIHSGRTQLEAPPPTTSSPGAGGPAASRESEKDFWHSVSG